MSLNIKNERVHALAREASRRTGKSQTSVIEEALTRLLADLDEPNARDQRRASAERIADAFEARLSEADRQRLNTDDLYDDRGLPA